MLNSNVAEREMPAWRWMLSFFLDSGYLQFNCRKKTSRVEVKRVSWIDFFGHDETQMKINTCQTLNTSLSQWGLIINIMIKLYNYKIKPRASQWGFWVGRHCKYQECFFIWRRPSVAGLEFGIASRGLKLLCKKSLWYCGNPLGLKDQRSVSRDSIVIAATCLN